jgi:hypothetical protein
LIAKKSLDTEKIPGAKEEQILRELKRKYNHKSENEMKINYVNGKATAAA